MANKEGPISRYIGTASETKPSGATIPIGSTFLEYDNAVLKTTPDSGSTWFVKDATPLEFLFRPGQSALSGGMVAASTRSYGETVSTTASVTTAWSSTVTYNPYQSGLIDGLSAGGVINGVITFGYIAASGTPNAKFTARVKNNSDSTWTTALALTANVAASIGVNYTTYEIPYLKTEANFNAVPFDLAIGVQSDASNSIQARLMESSYIMGEYIPGTTS